MNRSFTLRDLISEENLYDLSEASRHLTVSFPTEDSRKVSENSIFFAIKGEKFNGEAYIDSAVEKGARIVVLSVNTEFRALIVKYPDVIFIPVPFPRYVLARALAVYYGERPERMFAVTGTNGKTSTADFVRQLLLLKGENAASVGTLGVITKDGAVKTAHTTPDHDTIYKTLSDLKQKGVTHVAFEASSHGLAQFRLDGLSFRASAFTNLSRDHLDYHKNFEDYRSAKARLFAYLTDQDGYVVINADDANAAYMAEVCADNGLKILTFGKAGAYLKITGFEPTPDGQKIDFIIDGKTYQVTLPLAGAFQAYNALTALLLVTEPEDMTAFEENIALLACLKPVHGRLEKVGAKEGAAIYVDYAHTPDALETALQALRPHVSGKLVALFGCGGDRDKGKRPMMAQSACGRADKVFVTDDNPRSEEPADIRLDVMRGADPAKTVEIEGREAAIKAVLADLTPGDVALIAGKGHEEGQTIKGETFPFHDPTVVKNLLRAGF